jgi:hypothetical protein
MGPSLFFSRCPQSHHKFPAALCCAHPPAHPVRDSLAFSPAGRPDTRKPFLGGRAQIAGSGFGWSAGLVDAWAGTEMIG